VTADGRPLTADPSTPLCSAQDDSGGHLSVVCVVRQTKTPLVPKHKSGVAHRRARQNRAARYGAPLGMIIPRTKILKVNILNSTAAILPQVTRIAKWH
jgi:hypothetical protein